MLSTLEVSDVILDYITGSPVIRGGFLTFDRFITLTSDSRTRRVETKGVRYLKFKELLVDALNWNGKLCSEIKSKYPSISNDDIITLAFFEGI